MSCYHPITCYYKEGYKIQFKPFKGDQDKDYKKLTIGCGKCIGCKLDHSREWVARLLMEYETNNECYFLTLTYDDEHCPPSLRKRDIQLFIKRLRSKFDFLNIKYFICGEYGTSTFRPHYHAIIFGIDFFNSWFHIKKYDSKGHYFSDNVNNLWSHGYVVIAPANAANIGYTTRYTYKKVGVGLSLKKFGLQDNFLLCSQKLGLDYFLQNKDKIIKDNAIYFNGQRYSIPRYFLKKLEVFDNDNFKKIKSINERKSIRMGCAYSKIDLLQQEKLKMEKIRSLKRNKI